MKRREKKEWNKDGNKLQREEDKNSLFSCFSLNFFLVLLGLVTECDESLQMPVWNGALLLLLLWFDVGVCVCVSVHVGKWKQSSCLAIIFFKLTMFNFCGSRVREVLINPILIFEAENCCCCISFYSTETCPDLWSYSVSNKASYLKQLQLIKWHYPFSFYRVAPDRQIQFWLSVCFLGH